MLLGDFEYVTDYRDDAKLRGQFDELTREVFEGFSLEAWYKAGYWDDSYVCHSFLNRATGQMVANASVSRLVMRVRGEDLLGFQIGTVATRANFRGHGLSRALMERILAQVGERPVFLFANESVLDFYPQFGFRRMPVQSIAFSESTPETNLAWERVSQEDPRIAQFVRGERVVSTRFDVFSPALNLFHLLALHGDHLYLFGEGELLLVAEQTENQLEVHGLFARKPPEPAWLHGQLSWPGCEKIRYHFEPDGFGLPHKRELVDDRYFFASESFPTLSRDWYFPGLAVS